jgi:hypothetical protein
MSVCQIEERDAGRSYPRTCPTCKLSGTCAKGLDRKSMFARIEALEAELEEARSVILECLDEIDNYVRNEYPHDHPVQERYRQRDFAANPARIYLSRPKPMRCAECDCKGGGTDCNWIASPKP